ncbi:MAG: hypothetical protein HYS04_02085 [Acidobacteria bacterium]|nr:hypothetical protein [Acidobacteriota bacterium]
MRIPRGLLLCAIALETLLLVQFAFRDPAEKLSDTILIALLSHSVYICAVYLIAHRAVRSKPAAQRCTGTDRDTEKHLLLFILAAATVFRLTAFPLYPALSDDIYRYRWEGKLQAHGGNPYQTAPAAPEWRHLRDDAFAKVPSKDFAGMYGPLIELTGWATYETVSRVTTDPAWQVFWFKLPFALFDVGVIWAVLLLLRACGLAAERVLIYAWSPTPILEFWVNGHNDTMALFFMILALAAATRARWLAAHVLLGAAIAAKLWPVLLLPVFAGWKGRRPERPFHWLIAAAAVLACWLPYWSDVSTNLRFTTGFLGGWRNNDSLFGLVLWIAGGDLYRAKYTVMALVAVVSVAVTVVRWSPTRAALVVIVSTLLLSANCHPWYLTWFLPLVTIHVWPPLLLWPALMPLCYRVLFDWISLGEWRGSTPIRWLVYVPFFALAIGLWVCHKTRGRPGSIPR